MVRRSNNNANANGGVSYSNANNDASNANANIGSRLGINQKEIMAVMSGGMSLNKSEDIGKLKNYIEG